ncbi:MAG: type II/IV secretion system protein, partial [Pirellulaceae bacterium]
MITDAGELLVRRGLLSEDQLIRSRATAAGTNVIDSAIQNGFIAEDRALRALADETGLEFIDLRSAEVDLSLLANFPQKLIYRHAIFPIRQEHG